MIKNGPRSENQQIATPFFSSLLEDVDPCFSKLEGQRCFTFSLVDRRSWSEIKAGAHHHQLKQVTGFIVCVPSLHFSAEFSLRPD
jgi:hypothetical protein